jgi:hypothetical protein
MLRKRSYLQNPETGLFEGSSSDGSGSVGGGGIGVASKLAKDGLVRVDKAADTIRDFFRAVGKSAKTEAEGEVKVLGEAGNKTLDDIGKAVKVPGNTVKTVKIFYDKNNEKTAETNKAPLKLNQDKTYHLEANCEATRLGPGGKATAEFLSWAKEKYDVTMGYNTAKESADDMKANVAGRNADPAKTCKEAANEYWDSLPKENNSGKVINEKTFDLFGTRKKGK